MERKKKFIKATIFGIITLIIYFMLERYIFNKQGVSLSRVIKALPGTFIWYAFQYYCLGVGLIYGYPIVKNWLLNALSGCFIYIVLYIVLLALAVCIGWAFGWILYFIDLYHIIKKHPDPSEIIDSSETIQPIDYGDNFSRVNKEEKKDLGDNDESLQDALDSIDSFKNQ